MKMKASIYNEFYNEICYKKLYLYQLPHYKLYRLVNDPNPLRRFYSAIFHPWLCYFRMRYQL